MDEWGTWRARRSDLLLLPFCFLFSSLFHPRAGIGDHKNARPVAAGLKFGFCNLAMLATSMLDKWVYTADPIKRA